MWSRKELKEKAKVSFKANYWKSVLVALVLTLITGSAGAAAGNAANESSSELAGIDINVLIAALVVILVGVLLASIVSLLVKIFLLNPIEIGCEKYFINTEAGEGKLGDMGHGFKNGYKRNCGTLFLRGLFITLWSCLFIIPGIIKSYEYRMIPFILAEDSEITRKEAFAKSKEMMMGNKWNAFVLDLSFILWYLLVAITGGLAGVFYVFPYIYHTDAELYLTLKNAK